MSRLRTGGLAATALIFAGSLAACGSTKTSNSTTNTTASAAPTAVPIGVAFSTGATFGAVDQPGQAGVMMAVKEIKDAGGFTVAGKKYYFDATVIDTTDTPAQATAAVQGLIDSKKPIAIFGPTVSANAIVTQVPANRAKVINFSASTAWGTILGKPETKYLVKTKPAEKTAAKLLFDQILKDHSTFKTAAVINDDSASGHAIGDVYTADLKARGFTVETVYYPSDLTDFSSIITKIGAGKPDVIAVGTQPAGIAGVFDKATAAGVGKLFYSTSCSYRATHKFTADRPFVCMGNPADLEFSKDAKVTEFATRLKAFQGKPLDGQSIWSLTQYPYVFALADAMTSAGSVTDTDAIIAKLRGYKNDKIVSLQIGDTGEVITQVDVSTSVGPDVSVVSVHP